MFPAAHWQERRRPGIGYPRLDAVARPWAAAGCVVKNGYVVKSWGSQDETERLVLVGQAGAVDAVDVRRPRGQGCERRSARRRIWLGPAAEKDRTMTFRHLASMTSGYARPEPPGEAWAYNDYAIQLYQKTLFDKVFQGQPEAVVSRSAALRGARPARMACSSGKTNRRMTASVRDFARVAWFWLNRGQLERDAAICRGRTSTTTCGRRCRAICPISSRRADERLSADRQLRRRLEPFQPAGPGIYGFNWWFNAMGGKHPDRSPGPTRRPTRT